MSSKPTFFQCGFLSVEGARCTNGATKEVIVFKDPELFSEKNDRWYSVPVCEDHQFNNVDTEELENDLKVSMKFPQPEPHYSGFNQRGAKKY